NPSLLVTLGNMLCLSFLLVGVLVFVATRHCSSPPTHVLRACVRLRQQSAGAQASAQRMHIAYPKQGELPNASGPREPTQRASLELGCRAPALWSRGRGRGGGRRGILPHVVVAILADVAPILVRIDQREPK